MEMCPVCTQESVKKNISGIIDGEVYYFCCEKCKANFLAEPRIYLNCCQNFEDNFSSEKGDKENGSH